MGHLRSTILFVWGAKARKYAERHPPLRGGCLSAQPLTWLRGRLSVEWSQVSTRNRESYVNGAEAGGEAGGRV